MDMVAEKTGVGKTTIYRRWPSRDDLILEAMTYIQYPHAKADTGNLRGDLTILLKALVGFLNRPIGGKVYAAFLNAALRNPKLAVVRAEIASAARLDYEKAIARAIKRGELDPDVNVRLMVDILISPFIYRRIADNTNARPQDIREIIEMVLAAFGRSPHTADA